LFLRLALRGLHRRRAGLRELRRIAPLRIHPAGVRRQSNVRLHRRVPGGCALRRSELHRD
jgi:hypothetical protein